MRNGVTSPRALLHYDGTDAALTRLVDDLKRSDEKSRLHGQP
jgi:hypothetical protein